MKLVKPLRLGVLTRPFEQDLQYKLSIAVVTFFPFDEPDRLLPEPNMWKLAGEILGQEAVLDECMPKLSGEVLMAGAAHPPAPPQPHCRVRLSMGPVDRALYVFGDRTWKTAGPTDPAPFDEMPLTWARAFGGEGFARNPRGKGLRTNGEQPLPNLEDPAAIIRAPSDRPEPACFLPLDLAWPQRHDKAGTYDSTWLEQRYPGFPSDFDWRFFQVAQEGQRFPSFIEPGSPFTVENMHRQHPRLVSRLPLGRGRCIVVRRVGGKEETFDVATRIDTVWLFPNRMRGAVFHRGVIDVAEDDASDVLYVVGAYELPERALPVSHYEKALADRLDKRALLTAALRDGDFLPELPRKGDHPDDDLSDMRRLLARDNVLGANARRGAERRLAGINARFEKVAELRGVSLAELPPEAGEMSLDDVAEARDEALVHAEEVREKVEADLKAAEERARTLAAQHGLDYDKLRAEAIDRERRRKRRYSAGEEIAKLEAMATLVENAEADASALRRELADPKLRARLDDVERKVNEAYLRSAHLQEATLAEPDEYSREELVMGAELGRSFAKRDLTRADLSNLDLRGIDLEGAFLEGATLRGSVLDGANLRGAVLARADLRDARFVSADLTDANLGGARFERAVLDAAVLERATLWATTVVGASLRRARLSNARLGLAVIEDVDLCEADMGAAILARMTLRRVRLEGANLQKSVFVEGEIDDVDMRRAKLTSAVFVATRGDRVAFDGAEMSNARFVKECVFQRATLTRADLRGANLRGASFVGADFTAANLDCADVSEANLSNAILDDARANEALFIRANLDGASVKRAVAMQAIMQKTSVVRADFDGANLFRSDALFMRGDGGTRFDGAFVKRVRLTPRGRHG